MVTVVFGIQGVGKSTLIKEVIKKNSDFERLYWGDFACDMATELKLVENVDEIRNLPIRVQRDLQSKVGEKMAKIIESNPDKHYIIETHAALKTHEGFMAGFTPEILEKLKPVVFFVIEAHAIDIYHRRILDETRKRDHDKTVKEIQVNLDATRWYATTFSILSCANMVLIENVEDNLDIAIDRMGEVLRSYVE